MGAVSAVDAAAAEPTPARPRVPLLAVDAGPGRRPDRVGRALRRAAARGVGAAVAVGRERDRGAGGGRRRPAGPGDDGGPARRLRRGRVAPGRAPPPHGHAPPRRRRPPRRRSTRSPSCWPRCSTSRERPLRDWPTVVGDAPPEVLVCGHGRRDPCCGRWGTLLHVELAARGSARACGGAATPAGTGSPPPPSRSPTVGPGPTPTPTLLDGVLARTGDVARAGRPRPRLHRVRPVGAGRGAGAVRRARLGVARRRGHERPHGGRRRRSVGRRRARVAAGRRHHRSHADGEVVVTRTLPVLVCGEPPEMAKKTSPELGAARASSTPEVRGA